MTVEEQAAYWKERAKTAEKRLAELTIGAGKDETRLPPAQRKVYGYLLQHVRKNGYVPSVREITKALGLRSTSTVQGHLDTLKQKGYIERMGEKGAKRSIKIL